MIPIALVPQPFSYLLPNGTDMTTPQIRNNPVAVRFIAFVALLINESVQRGNPAPWLPGIFSGLTMALDVLTEPTVQPAIDAFERGEGAKAYEQAGAILRELRPDDDAMVDFVKTFVTVADLEAIQKYYDESEAEHAAHCPECSQHGPHGGAPNVEAEFDIDSFVRQLQGR